jgi:hypothetical protein
MATSILAVMNAAVALLREVFPAAGRVLHRSGSVARSYLDGLGRRLKCLP